MWQFVLPIVNRSWIWFKRKKVGIFYQNLKNGKSGSTMHRFYVKYQLPKNLNDKSKNFNLMPRSSPFCGVSWLQWKSFITIMPSQCNSSKIRWHTSEFSHAFDLAISQHILALILNLFSDLKQYFLVFWQNFNVKLSQSMCVTLILDPHWLVHKWL